MLKDRKQFLQKAIENYVRCLCSGVRILYIRPKQAVITIVSIPPLVSVAPVVVAVKVSLLLLIDI